MVRIRAYVTPGRCRCVRDLRLLWLRGLGGLRFSGGRLAIACSEQPALKLRPFVWCHNGTFARRWQIFYREISACFRRRRRFSPRIHQRRASSGSPTPTERDAQQQRRSHSERPDLFVHMRYTHARSFTRSLRVNYVPRLICRSCLTSGPTIPTAWPIRSRSAGATSAYAVRTMTTSSRPW
jgi:hypothetical protein